MKHALWLSTNYSNKCFIYFLFAGKRKSQTTIIWNTCSFCYSNHSSHCYIKQQRWFVFVLLWSSILFCGLHCPTLLRLTSNMSKAIEEGARKQKQLRQRMTSTISLPDHWTSIEIARNIGTALVMEWSYSVILIFSFSSPAENKLMCVVRIVFLLSRQYVRDTEAAIHYVLSLCFHQ